MSGAFLAPYVARHLYMLVYLIALLSVILYVFVYRKPISTSPPMNAAMANATKRAILGRGCDPVRAAFAAKHWGPQLGVDIETATSDAELL